MKDAELTEAQEHVQTLLVEQVLELNKRNPEDWPEAAESTARVL